MYDSTFADRIIKMLKDYVNLTSGLSYQPLEFIEGFYQTEGNFDELPGAKIFINEKDLNAWMSLVIKKSKSFLIHRKIDSSVGFSTLPYLYEDEDGKIYIIQNVFGGESKALATAKMWYTNKINLGNDLEPLDEIPVHMVYGISSESTLVPMEDNTDDNTEILRVVYYGTRSEKGLGKDGRWGAILEIL